MSSQLQQELQAFAASESLDLLTRINRGIEKESLRVTGDGHLAQTPHPPSLGSALTHDFITTDYSEALLEFITPVSDSIEATLEELENIHAYVCRNLGDELLWATSMPCGVGSDEEIPVATYGTSNVARMKTIYRLGLGHRYGRLMQTIAGIHYNFSMPEEYWDNAWSAAGRPGQRRDYVTERYLGLIRNFRRYSWLLIYLFGASPAVCESFLRGRSDHGLQPLEEAPHTFIAPHGTALRMGGLGYNSHAQRGLNICYNSLSNYINTLRRAIRHPYPAYKSFTGGEEMQQLNTSLLQIENEFYSPIRPKRVTRSGEAPLVALKRDGIEYIEVRCVDVNPFLPVGIDAEQIRFMDAFLLFCLFRPSPLCDEPTQTLHDENFETVVNRGREPGLRLQTPDGLTSVGDLAEPLMAEIRQVAELLDRAHGETRYREAAGRQWQKFLHPELTPSARVLEELRSNRQPFYSHAMQHSRHWNDYFRDHSLPPDRLEAYMRESQRSLASQIETERSDTLDFATYLERYYSQYDTL